MKKLKVVILTNTVSENSSQDAKAPAAAGAAREVEQDIQDALTKSGHEVRLLGVKDDIKKFFDALLNCQDELVFNVCESFRDDSRLEMHVAAALELASLKFTGSGPAGLLFAQDKGVTKKILAYHGIKSPDFAIYPRGEPIELRPSHLRFPLIVKPLSEDASIGIGANSIVKTDDALKERASFVHEKMEQDALVEEYIEGREFYVGLLGFESPEVLPIIEIDFSGLPKDKPKIASFRAKWNTKYREEWGIRSFFPKDLSEELVTKIREVSSQAFRVLKLRDYGRLDLRVAPDDEVYVLEANPNPYIAQGEDLPDAAAKAGMKYPEFLEKILEYALKRY